MARHLRLPDHRLVRVVEQLANLVLHSTLKMSPLGVRARLLDLGRPGLVRGESCLWTMTMMIL